MFSVIIPVYNGAEFIEKAIDSVFAQSRSDWELIVVNDGSGDATAEILRKYYDVQRVRVITQENAGVSAARNRGIAEANGSHIAFLDADDVWHSDHLEVMGRLIERYPSAGLYGSFTRTELVNGGMIDRSEYFIGQSDSVLLDNFLEEYYRDKSAKLFTVITTCIPRHVFDKVGGFPVGCRIGEDLELTLRIAAYYPVALTGRATATYIKENSVATKENSFDPDWRFFDTVSDLYEDESIPKLRRESLRRLMQWFTMRRCRHYMIDGRRRDAWVHFSEIGSDPRLRKDKFITLALMCMPSAAVKRIFAVRWRSKA